MIVVLGIGVKIKKVLIYVIVGKVNWILDIEIDIQVEELEEVQVIGKFEVCWQQEQVYVILVFDIKKVYNSVVFFNKLLNNVLSVCICEEGGMGFNYNFSLNGFLGNQVKFFLDGILMDNFGLFFNFVNILVNMVECVEVYKGVLFVNLGVDVLGGVVNIVSCRDVNYLDVIYFFGFFNIYKVLVNGVYIYLKIGFMVCVNVFYNYFDNDYKVFVFIIDLVINKKINEWWVRCFNDVYWLGGICLEMGIINKFYVDYLFVGIIFLKNDKDVQIGVMMDVVYGGVKMKSEFVIFFICYKKDDLFFDGFLLLFYGMYNFVNIFNVDIIVCCYNWLGEFVLFIFVGEGYYMDFKIKNCEWLGNGNISYVIDGY